MARPKKQTVDYFPHYCTHGKTLFILEQRFGITGYGFWFKLLEELGRHEGHFLDLRDENELEFLGAKTHVSGAETLLMLNLASKLGAIDPKLWENRVVWCQKFVDNLTEVYAKRTVSVPRKPVSIPDNPVSDTDNPQMKVNESKLHYGDFKKNTPTPNMNHEELNDDKQPQEVTDSEQIQQVMEVFYKINPTLNWGNKTQRKAIAEMIQKFTFEKTKGLAEYAVSIQGLPFSPTITTPYQLKEKASALIVYHQKELNSKPKGITIAGV